MGLRQRTHPQFSAEFTLNHCHCAETIFKKTTQIFLILAKSKISKYIKRNVTGENQTPSSLVKLITHNHTKICAVLSRWCKITTLEHKGEDAEQRNVVTPHTCKKDHSYSNTKHSWSKAERGCRSLNSDPIFE